VGRGVLWASPERRRAPPATQSPQRVEGRTARHGRPSGRRHLGPKMPAEGRSTGWVSPEGRRAPPATQSPQRVEGRTARHRHPSGRRPPPGLEVAGRRGAGSVECKLEFPLCTSGLGPGLGHRWLPLWEPPVHNNRRVIEEFSSVDAMEQEMVRLEGLVSQVRARQLEILETIDNRISSWRTASAGALTRAVNDPLARWRRTARLRPTATWENGRMLDDLEHAA